MRNFKQKDLFIFDFTDVEIKILSALLKKSPLSVSAIGRTAGIPRTTAYSALLRLKDRKLVVREKVGGLFLWRMIGYKKLEYFVKENLEVFDKHPETKTQGAEKLLGNFDAEKLGVKIFKGKREILKVYKKLFEDNKSERIFAIQGSGMPEKLINKPQNHYLFGFHQKFKRVNIVLGEASGEPLLDSVADLTKEFLQVQLSRSVNVATLPDRFLNFGLDIIVMREVVIFILIEKETIVLFENKEFVSMFIGFAHLMKNMGENLCLHEFIQKCIDEK